MSVSDYSGNRSSEWIVTLGPTRGGGGGDATPLGLFKFYQEDFIWALVHFSSCSFIFDTHLL